MGQGTLNKICNICTQAKMDAEFYFREKIFNKDTGKSHSENRYICGHCKSTINRRCKQIIEQVFPRGLRQTMYQLLRK
jgi:hypothetical protein